MQELVDLPDRVELVEDLKALIGIAGSGLTLFDNLSIAYLKDRHSVSV